MTWKQYHRIEDIYGFMDFLAKTYPSLISIKTIGKSFEGKDLKVGRPPDLLKLEMKPLLHFKQLLLFRC